MPNYRYLSFNMTFNLIIIKALNSSTNLNIEEYYISIITAPSDYKEVGLVILAIYC